MVFPCFPVVFVQALRAKLAEQATGVADTSCSLTGFLGVTSHVKRHQVVPSRTKSYQVVPSR